MVIFHPRQAPDQKPPVFLIKPDLVPPVGLFYSRMGRCLSINNALLWGKTLIEDKLVSDCLDKTKYSSRKTLYPNELGWSKSPMARQVAQWVSGFDFCCLVVQLRHASLIRLTCTELGAKKIYRGIEFNFGTKAYSKEGLAFQLASLGLCD